MPEPKKLSFACDYEEGAHPNILKRLVETNFEKQPGYGADEYSESARNRIREACGTPEAEVHFLAGGTQTNANVIDAILRSYEGVVAATTGHVAVHEAGAIEYCGHKVLPVEAEFGKISAAALEKYLGDFAGDGNRDHMVQPGMVYISQPTEYGTLYRLSELEAIKTVCEKFEIPLYVDGARLAYALASPANDVTLKDLARICDAFYIGGTKCGALIGEAVVFPRKGLVRKFFTSIKQHGALLAKGRLCGIQFDELFRDGLYFKVGENAIRMSMKLQKALKEKGYELLFDSPTNQILVVLENRKMAELEKKVVMSFWEKRDDTHTLVRFATSWATKEEDVDRLISIL
ncbi:MAG: beta-eliminating lyase-related protein [Sutterellaceae bacterium]|nr:beta-eliminating lyase-related protein [Sutterellaceae bacterium]MDY2868399.1 beta-eliminating lyase-related protein [Mesosutterella sp.]